MGFPTISPIKMKIKNRKLLGSEKFSVNRTDETATPDPMFQFIELVL